MRVTKEIKLCVSCQGAKTEKIFRLLDKSGLGGHPGFGTVHPGIGTVHPGFGTVHPGFGTVHPGFGALYPVPGFHRTWVTSNILD